MFAALEVIWPPASTLSLSSVHFIICYPDCERVEARDSTYPYRLMRMHVHVLVNRILLHLICISLVVVIRPRVPFVVYWCFLLIGLICVRRAVAFRLV